MKNIYLDNNATTAVKPEVTEAMLAVLKSGALNASSIHAKGRQARALVDSTREKLLQVLGLSPDLYNVFFTASGSEANNLAIRCINAVDKIAASAVEHVSVLNARKDLEIIPVDKNGIVKFSELEKIIKDKKTLVSVMLVNNETGIIQPLKEIADIVRSAGGILHTDAVQAFGKIEYDYKIADMITVSAHKFGGPQGAAALIVKKGIQLSSVISGGGQEFGIRAGTHNVAAIAGFAKALELLGENINTADKIKKLREKIENEIKLFAAEVEIFGIGAERVANTICLEMPGVKSETQLIEFDLAGICVSAGSACSSGKVNSSHVLAAMGVEKHKAENSIRVSLGFDNTEEEADYFINCWKKLYKRAEKQAA